MRKTYVCHFLFCADLLLFCLFRKCGRSWKLFFYDLCSGFKDYSEKPWLIFGFFVLLYFFLTFCIKKEFLFEWRISVGIKGKKDFSLCLNTCVAMFLLGLYFLIFTSMSIKDMYEGWAKHNFWQGSNIIGHSFGSIDGKSYTGSKEAFEVNYARGYRTFEVDLEITSDERVVLRHDWDYSIQKGISSENIPTEAEFLAIPIWGIYTPLSFKDLCLLMKEYPDIWIVTDSKYADEENVKKQFSIMLQTVEECDATDILDRMIVQIYNEEMYETLCQIYSFKSFIFTLYQRWDGTTEEFIKICRWCVENNVDVIAMWDYFADEEIISIAKRYKREIYVHTVNDVSSARQLKITGVRGFYTDDIRPEELEDTE